MNILRPALVLAAFTLTLPAQVPLLLNYQGRVVVGTTDLCPTDPLSVFYLRMEPLAGATVSDNGDERTVTDPNATSPRKLYRVDVQKR